MNNQQRRNYDQEFKDEAGRPVVEEKMSIACVARDLGINENLLHKWKRRYLDSTDPEASGPLQSISEQEELARLRSENRRLTMERDIKKKAVGIFSERSK